MLEFYVLIILIFAYIAIAYQLISVPALLVNISLIIIIAIRVKADLKELRMQVYYITSTILTVVILAASTYGFLGWFLNFLTKVNVFIYSQAMIILFVVAHLLRLGHNLVIELKKQWIKKSG